MSFCFFSAVELIGSRYVLATPYGNRDDHLAHIGSVLLFERVGLRMFDTPATKLSPAEGRVLEPLSQFEDVKTEDLNLTRVPGQGPIYLNWMELPRPYPPGAMLLAVPLAWVFEHTTLSLARIGQLAVIQDVLGAHLAAFVALLVLRHALKTPEGAVLKSLGVLIPFITFELLRWSMRGFYDVYSVLFGFLTLFCLQRNRPITATLMFSAALFLHFRALWLLPLFAESVLAARVQIRREGVTRTTAIALAGTGLLLGASLFVFVRVWPSLAHFPHNNPLGAKPFWASEAFWEVASVAAAVAWFERKSGDAWSFIRLAWPMLFIVSTPQVQQWHGLFFLPVMIGAFRSRSPATAWRAVALYTVVSVCVFRSVPLPSDLVFPLITGRF